MSSNWLKMVLFETQNLCEFSIFQNVKIIRHNNIRMTNVLQIKKGC